MSLVTNIKAAFERVRNQFNTEKAARVNGDKGGVYTLETLHTAGARRTSLDTNNDDELARVAQVANLIVNEELKSSTEKMFEFDFFASQLDLINRNFIGVNFSYQKFGTGATWTTDDNDLGGNRGYLKRQLPINAVADTHEAEVIRLGSPADQENFLDIYEFVTSRIKLNVAGHASFIKAHQVQMGIMPEHHATNFSIYVSRSPFQVVDTGVAFTVGDFYTIGFRASAAFNALYGVGIQWFIQDETGTEIGSGNLTTQAFETFRQNYLEIHIHNRNNATAAEAVVDFVRAKRTDKPRYSQPIKSNLN